MSSDTKPTIALCMIVRDEEKLLGRCLASISPYVDEIVVVDTGSRDRTVEVAESFGAKVYPFKWVDDFAAARNYARSLVKSDWYVWTDADDIWPESSAVALHEVIAECPDDVQIIVTPYFYDQDQFGNWICYHKKERIIRTTADLPWINRIHECLRPVDPQHIMVCDDIVVEHHRDITKGSSFARNTKLLKIMMKESPDPRFIFDMANEHFFARKWKEAIPWYVKFCETSNWLLQKYQSLCRIAQCLRELGIFQDAIKFNIEAIATMPDMADAYFGMLENECHLQNWNRALHWAGQGHQMRPMDAVMVVNPMDYTFRPALFESVALARLGRVEEAIKICQDAYKLCPLPELQKDIDTLTTALQHSREIQATNTLLDIISPIELQAFKSYLPDYVLNNGIIKERISTTLHSHAPKRSDRIVIYCGPHWETWGPESLTKVGIGGSETAAIHMSQELAKLGYYVDVYAFPGREEGQYSNVGWWDSARFNPDDPAELLVVSRIPQLCNVPTKAHKKWLWCHDLHYQDEVTSLTGEYFDRIMPVSRWHGEYLKMCYNFLPPEKVRATRNGLDLTRFSRQMDKIPGKAVYSSSPDRGLEQLLAGWREIKARVPEAELHIFYGFNNMQEHAKEYTYWSEFEVNLKALMTQPGVVWRDRVDQQTLAYEMQTAEALLYPTNFLEVSCCVGDTLIDMPRDYTRYPKGIPIKELVGRSNFMVYAYNNETNRISLGQVKWVAKTRTNAPVWKLTLDDGSCLRATPDHKIMMRDGNYRELQYLHPGDSLMPLYKNVSITVNRNGGKHELEHRMVAEAVLGRKLTTKEHVHHVDGNPFNNDPANLVVLSDTEHHKKHNQGRVFSSITLQRMKEAQRKFFDSLTPEQLAVKTAHFGSKAAKDFWDGMSAEERADFVARRAKAIRNHRGAAYVSSEQKQEWGRMGALARWNHTVVSVEPDGYEDVYDMEVGKYHNFVANGIVIHNCITAMEAMAAKTLIISSHCGALPETVGDCGILVKGHIRNDTYMKRFLGFSIAALSDKSIGQRCIDNGAIRAKQLGWDGVAIEWAKELSA